MQLEHSISQGEEDGRVGRIVTCEGRGGPNGSQRGRDPSSRTCFWRRGSNTKPTYTRDQDSDREGRGKISGLRSGEERRGREADTFPGSVVASIMMSGNLIGALPLRPGWMHRTTVARRLLSHHFALFLTFGLLICRAIPYFCIIF
jgi:hypothetical protein